MTDAAPNQWHVRMIQLLEVIAATPVEGDRENLLEQLEVARINAADADHDAEVAGQEAAAVEAEQVET